MSTLTLYAPPGISGTFLGSVPYNLGAAGDVTLDSASPDIPLFVRAGFRIQDPTSLPLSDTGTLKAAPATESAAGTFSASDKTKLDGMTSGAAVASVGVTAPIVSTGPATGPTLSIAAATPSTAGSLSAADKATINKILGQTADIVVTKNGVVADVVELTDAAITTGTAALTSASASFTSGDVGKTILVVGADTNGNQLCKTIASITSATAVVLSGNAGTTVTGAACAYGTDVGPAVQTLINAAPQGARIVFPASATAYMIGTGLRLKSDIRLVGYGARVISALSSNVYDPTGVPFFTGIGMGAGINLHAATLFGARTITIDGTVAVGNVITLVHQPGQGLDGIYDVVAVSGSSPQTVTLDRPTLQAFGTSGTTVGVLSTPADRLSIEGFTITGRAYRYLEIISTRYSLFRDLVFDCRTYGNPCDPASTPGSGIIMGLDGACYRCLFDGVTVLGSLSTVGFEGAESCVMTRYTYEALTVAPTAGAGFNLNQCYACTLSEFSIQGAYHGVELDGTALCRIQNGTVGKTNSAGNAYYLNGCLQTHVRSVSAIGSANGLTISAGSVGTKVYDSYFRGCVSAGIGDIGQDTELVGCTVEPPAAGGPISISLSGTGRTVVTACTCRPGDGTGGAYGSITVASNSALPVEVVFRDCEIQQDGTNGSVVSITGLAATDRVMFSGCRIDAPNARPSGLNGIATNSGNLTVIDTTIQAHANTTGILTYGTFGTLRTRNVRQPAGGTPVNLSVGVQNRGTLTMNGTTNVVVAFTDMQTQDRVYLSRTSNGSVASTTPYVQKTTGTGFSVSAAATDTDTYDWAIL